MRRMPVNQLCLFVFSTVILTSAAAATEPQTHLLCSERQSRSTSIHVLIPDELSGRVHPFVREPTARSEDFAVLYLLPVEAGEGTRWGSSIDEVRKHDLHNRYRVICVFPEFADLPWYADNPEDSRMQQESWLLKDVLPFVEQNYPVRRCREGRLLAGFSKSGWGAWSLLLRHPETFYRAAAFDAPLMMSEPGKFGSGPVFGTVENFRQYQLTDLIHRRAPALKGQPARLGLLGQGSFEPDHRQMVTLLTMLKIPFRDLSGGPREHSWNSGWLSDAVQWLAEP